MQRNSWANKNKVFLGWRLNAKHNLELQTSDNMKLVTQRHFKKAWFLKIWLDYIENMFNALHKTTGVFSSAQKHFFSSSEISRSGLLQFRDKGQFSDVILDVFGTKIAAHKIVLATNSEHSMTVQERSQIIYFVDKGEGPGSAWLSLYRPYLYWVTFFILKECCQSFSSWNCQWCCLLWQLHAERWIWRAK